MLFSIVNIDFSEFLFVKCLIFHFWPKEKPPIVASETSNGDTSGPSTESKPTDNQQKTRKVSKLSTSQRSLIERNIKARSMAFLPNTGSLASRPNIPGDLF